MGALQLPPFRDTATQLGYPAYFMSILGVWYISAGLVLLAPRLPRLKESAYARLAVNYTGAAASHIAIGNDVKTVVAPTVFVISRPSSRRRRSLASAVAVAAELAVGGVWDHRGRCDSWVSGRFPARRRC